MLSVGGDKMYKCYECGNPFTLTEYDKTSICPHCEVWVNLHYLGVKVVRSP